MDRQRLTIKELCEILDEHRAQLGCDNNKVLPVWQHIKSGDYYLVKDVLFREEDMMPMVVYVKITPVAKGLNFGRPYHEFRNKFERVPRAIQV